MLHLWCGPFIWAYTYGFCFEVLFSEWKMGSSKFCLTSQKLKKKKTITIIMATRRQLNTELRCWNSRRNEFESVERKTDKDLNGIPTVYTLPEVDSETISKRQSQSSWQIPKQHCRVWKSLSVHVNYLASKSCSK